MKDTPENLYREKVCGEVNTLCNVRDEMKEMLGDTYEGKYRLLKPLGDSGSQYKTTARKTTLKEARKRIAASVDKLNRVINIIIEP